jgi:hypothetical protein
MNGSPIMTTIPDIARRWIDDNAFATIATILPNGYPQQTVVRIRPHKVVLLSR